MTRRWLKRLRHRARAAARVDCGALTGRRPLSDHRVVFTPSGKRGDFAEARACSTPRAARRRSRFGLRRPRHLRALPDRRRRRAFRQARLDFARRPCQRRGTRSRQRYADERGALAAGRRLGCQAQICGDLVVDVPPESQVHRQVVRKRAEAHPIALDPVVRLHYVEVARARHARSVERLPPAAAGARASNGGSPTLRADLARAARACRRRCAPATGRSPSRCARAATSSRSGPGFIERAFGVAVDIGSTTIAAHLCDLASGEVARLGRA